MSISNTQESRPPIPPFTLESAKAKVQAAEDVWNTKSPEKVSLAYSKNTTWRNRSDFINGRDEVREFLSGKWEREKDYKLQKTLWSYTENRIAVKFFYEWRDDKDQWHRSYGNELWEFEDNGLMREREASINDIEIEESERKLK